MATTNILKPTGSEKAASGDGSQADPWIRQQANSGSTAIQKPWGYEKASGTGTDVDPFIPVVSK